MAKGNNVLLIWPEREKGLYNLDPIGLITGYKSLFFPLPLIYVAAALGEEWNYTLVDEGIEPVSDSMIEQADFYLISVNVLQRFSADTLLKRLIPQKKPIIIGGPLISTLNHIFNHPGIHKVYGEIEALEASHLENRMSIAECLSHDMINGTLQKEYHSRGHPDLTKIKIPRYDLIKRSDYFALSMLTSRGCPHHCDFCQQITLYGQQRRKSNHMVEAELDSLLKLRHNVTVIIIDDNLMGDISTAEKKQAFIDLLETIRVWQENHRYPFDFFMQCSLDIAEHEDLVELMSKIGLNIMFVGIETLDNDALASVHKKQNMEKDILAQIQTLQRYGMGIYAGVIIGFDNDSDETIQKQVEFINKSHIPLVAPSILQAFPGTPLYIKLLKENRISKDLDALTKVFHTNVLPLFHPKKLYAYLKLYLQKVYEPKVYFNRCIEWIRNWNDAYVIPGKKGSLPPNVYIKRIIRSIFYQGIIAEYRIEYCKYIIKSVIIFGGNYNKIALAFYLSYMYQAAYRAVKNAEHFVDDLPQYIIDEWERSFLSHHNK